MTAEKAFNFVGRIPYSECTLCIVALFKKSDALISSDSWTQGNAVLLHVSHLAFLECNYLTEHYLKSTVYLLSFFLSFSPFKSQTEAEIRCFSQCYKSLLGLVELNAWRPHRVNENSGVFRLLL